MKWISPTLIASIPTRRRTPISPWGSRMLFWDFVLHLGCRIGGEVDFPIIVTESKSRLTDDKNPSKVLWWTDRDAVFEVRCV